jgi:hypothetical protein
MLVNLFLVRMENTSYSPNNLCQEFGSNIPLIADILT